ncbi:MAG: hypothetical protein KIT84_07470 [Labilithrix sp.]|nr:hypothetical protein [Labilithrix sp.]MCW5810834.1 hypothetical protein [Labilithrix sp.]
MKLLRPPPDLAVLGLRAIHMVGTSDGPLRPAVRRLMLAAQSTFLGVDVPVDDLAPIEPAELARSFPPPLREQIVRAMIVATLVDGEPSAAATATVRRFAKELEVDEPGLDTIELFARRHFTLGKIDYFRRSNIARMLRTELEEHGLVEGALRLFGARGWREDPTVAAPFVALGDLPAGTLGRALFTHYRTNGFSFPGERNGFPEAGVYHDLTHVLGGYATTPLGELQIGAFSAGYIRESPFYVAMLPLLLFCAEINVTPIPHDRVDDLFSHPGVAERYIRALERGSKVKRDLSDRWDFWPEMRRPIDDVRRDLGIDPDEAPPPDPVLS